MSSTFKTEEELSPYSGTGSEEDFAPDHEDVEQGSAQSAGGTNPAPLEAVPQKRKGGRKPIYATSEERKQRNRQAQAAFRERRTEYIKHLENTIKAQEETMHSLQHRNIQTADENMSLKYRTSLLERIMMDKGMDPNAELSQRSGSPSIGLPPPGAMMGHPSHSSSPQSIHQHSYQSPHRPSGPMGGPASKSIPNTMYGMQPSMYAAQHVPQGSYGAGGPQPHQSGHFQQTGQPGRMVGPGSTDMFNPANQGHPYNPQQQRSYATSGPGTQPGQYSQLLGLPAPIGHHQQQPQQPFLGSSSYQDQAEQMEGYQTEHPVSQPQHQPPESHSAPFPLGSRQMPGPIFGQPPTGVPDVKSRFPGPGHEGPGVGGVPPFPHSYGPGQGHPGQR